MILSLRSGKHVVARGEPLKILSTVHAMRDIRNNDEVWTDLLTPWKVLKIALVGSGLELTMRGKTDGIDPFTSLSVWKGREKYINVWT